MSRGMTKYERLEEMVRLYHQRAFSDIEMAKRLSMPDHRVDRTTVYRYRKELEAKHPFVQDDDGHWRIDRTRFLSNIQVNVREGLSLYLAARRASQQTQNGGRDAASALEKLAMALRQPMTERLVQAADVILQQKSDANRDKIFETVANAWVEGRRLRIRYQGLAGTRPYEDVISPYLIEPTPWSDAVYVIGPSDKLNDVVSYRLDRIEHAFMSGETFTIPNDFDEKSLLRHAWGVWRGAGDPVRVRLKFAPGPAAKRLKESVWHPLEKVSDTDGGGCTWETPIAEWREMVPWVRSWGADVIVEEPAELRAEIEKTATRYARQYEISTECEKLPHQIPYAKTNQNDEGEIHLLLYHLIDVGQVALIMWVEIFTDSIRGQLASALDLSVADCGRFLAFLTALHDLGKAGPAYQKKYAPEWLKKELVKAGLGLIGHGRAYEKTFPHGTVTTWALRTLLPDMLGIDNRFAKKIAFALGGHHGVWPRLREIDHISDNRHPEWGQVRRDLVWELIAVFNPPVNVSLPVSTAELNTFLTILSGLTSVADWIGSRNDECFKYVQQPMSSRRYTQRSAEKAREGLSDLGWMGWQPTGETRSFAETFDYLGFDAPRQVQQQVIDVTADLETPTLLILEAPTGIGKTETALYVAERWLQQYKGRGLYVAMPTQATSNQMYERTGEFLHRRYPDMPINYHLVHGQAAWLDELKKKVELQGVGDEVQAHVSAESWFNPRKRTLLAPFGVGTVDQTLMSILQTKHFFVRLFGLSHKVVIFDEVHAYDTYMNTLFHHLLTWLNAIGASVIILSATLPAKTRRELVKAYIGQNLPPTQADYPALTIANAQRQETIPLPKPANFTLQLDWSVGREPTAIVEFLLGELTQGGCAAVICNTVRRAQEIYQVLDAARKNNGLDVAKDDLILFHSRFPPIWRKGIEEEVRTKFKKSGKRPHRAIVVATQVIEQSLDIDFDLMISDLAPVDLLLQRAGRLHRHDGNERYGLPRRLVMATPDLNKVGIPEFGDDTYIYAEYILLRTYLTLHNTASIEIPEDTTRYIEIVYDPICPLDLPPGINEEHLQQILREMRVKERKAQNKAGRNLVLAPQQRDFLAQEILGLDEENPEVHNTLRAQTRDIDFSITVVCLHKDEQGLCVWDDNDRPINIDLTDTPHPNLTKLLLQNAISIQSQWLGKYFVEQEPPQSWSKDSALRHCRVAVFEKGIYELPNFILKLSRDFGLETIRKETT